MSLWKCKNKEFRKLGYEHFDINKINNMRRKKNDTILDYLTNCTICTVQERL